MRLPRLGAHTVRAYLARLGEPPVSLDLEGLSRLQGAHLRALPFHALAGHAPPPSLEAAVEDNIAGLGGTWAHLTPPFIALLRALGFEAWLGEDHLGIVQLAQGRFALDVGYAHAFLRPWALDAPPSALEPAPAPLDFFERFLREHHAVVDPTAWSPDLQALRVSEWALMRVQGLRYQRAAGGLTTLRLIAHEEARAELLHTVFGLPRPRPSPARPEGSAGGARPRARATPREPLRFILSLAVTDRLESVDALLRSVTRALAATSRPVRSVGVLLLDNGRGQLDHTPIVEGARHQGLRVSVVEARTVLDRLSPFQRQGLLPSELSLPLPIGASRTLQACLLHEQLRAGGLDLPHPGDGEGPIAVWMLDDDVSLHRLNVTPEGLVVTPVDESFLQAESLWSLHPEVSVVLGTFTGEPPIPGYATFHVQTQDLAGNLRVMASRGPEEAWTPSEAPRDLSDYYYDHARGSARHLEEVFAWLPPGPPPWSVREAFTTLCEGFAHVPGGRQITRPLLHVASEALFPSRNRGGNALFLDLDALVAAPYPVLRGEGGIMTRRSDTLWAHLMSREPSLHLVQTQLDLLHGRRPGDGSSPLAEPQPGPEVLRHFVEAQERGVVLARLLESGRAAVSDAAREIRVRRELLARSRQGVRQGLADARAVLMTSSAWWWRREEDAASARVCLTALKRLEALSPGVEALEAPGLAEQLADFAGRVNAVLPDWRTSWG